MTGLTRQSIPALNGGVSQQSAATRGASQCEAALNISFSVAEGASKRNGMEILSQLREVAPGPESFDVASLFYAHIPWSTGDGFLLELPGDGSYRVYRMEDGQLLTAQNDATQAYLTTPTGVENQTNWLVQVVGRTVYIVNRSITARLTAAVAAGTLTGTAQTLQDNVLDSAAEGSIFKIWGDETNPYDTYFAKKVAGKWVEWVQPGIRTTIDTATMPHRVVLTPDDIDPFGVIADFGIVPWAERLVGDEKSNKAPSFIDRPITGIFFDSDRLGLLADNAVCLSETGEHANFWRTTVTDVLDTDRIDVTVASDGASNLFWAKNLGQQTVLFAPDKQFALAGRPVMSPRTISITEATSFPSSRVCGPVSIGPNLYFTSNTETGTSLREMFVQDDAVTNDAADVSAHVPYYIVDQVVQMAANPNYDFLALRPLYGNSLYVYQTYWAGDEKVQSAWNRWQIAAGNVLSVFCVGEYLYLVVTFADSSNNPKVSMCRINLRQRGANAQTLGPYGHGVLLDMLTRTRGVYNGVENRTYWTAPFPLFLPEYRDKAAMVIAQGVDTGKVRRILPDGTVNFYQAPGNDYSFYCIGDRSQYDVWLGLNYSAELTLSEQFYNDGNRAALAVRLQLRSMVVNVKDTAFFKTKIKMEGVDESIAEIVPSLESTFTARTVGNEYFVLNAPVTRSGSWRFPVLAKSSDVRITLINDEYTPSHFVSAEWEGLVTSRTRR